MAGSVGWYRRDFTVPSSAFERYVRASDRHWIIRFESVNYRATVWLNGKQIGTHSGAFLPFEFDLSGLHPAPRVCPAGMGCLDAIELDAVLKALGELC